MHQSVNNYAFIDGQNLYLGVLELGWRLDYCKFFVYLREKYGVRRAYLFLGYIAKNSDLYETLGEIGYTLIFKPTMRDRRGRPKGNIDADLVLRAVVDIDFYDAAVIVTGDGDFYSLVQHLDSQRKLKIVLSPSRRYCSWLLRKAAKDKIDFFDNLQFKLRFGNEKAPPRDETQGSAYSY